MFVAAETGECWDTSTVKDEILKLPDSKHKHVLMVWFSQKCREESYAPTTLKSDWRKYLKLPWDFETPNEQRLRQARAISRITKAPETLYPETPRSSKGISNKISRTLKFRGQTLTDLRTLVEAYVEEGKPNTAFYTAHHYGVIKAWSVLANSAVRFEDITPSELRILEDFNYLKIRRGESRYYLRDHPQLKEGFYCLMPWAEECGLVIDPAMYEPVVQQSAWYKCKTVYETKKFIDVLQASKRRLGVILQHGGSLTESPARELHERILETESERDYWLAKRDEEKRLADITIEDLL